ncbi:hypothetical protein HBN50_11465 [Halobacteriovorax sp. GB3]|uniref:beta strand repeat-containing protein n=1 Tax=Halobacteriovorax sp. GB3 TaxID=2719615 RepID=UPI0023606EC5|nr:hypothetical protein [Halobacteriovorax sp. GB3]MDD0853719.1 hypothetical protein [Halobacteriovorax sp. GB3]
MIKKISAFIMALSFCFTSFGEEISYSGRLVNPTTGTPISGPVSLSIKLYTEFPTSTFNLRCTQSTTNTNLSNGVFTVQLDYSSRCDSNTKDLSTVIEEAVTNNQKIYIEVEDTTNVKTYARQQINFAPMALYAKKATSISVPDNSIDVIKLTSSCANGQVIKSNGSGGFTCANDDTGLSSAITNVSSGEATNVTISSNDATIDVLYDNTTIGLSSNQLEVKDNAIATAKIQDNAITTAKIQDNAINGQKINSNQIATAHIQDGAITDIKITGISASKLSGIVPDANLPDITSTHILDGTITGSDIASATIALTQLNPTGCNSDQIVKFDLILNQFICADVSALSTNAWTENSGDIYRSSGNVGIGTTTPGTTLEVESSNFPGFRLIQPTSDGISAMANQSGSNITYLTTYSDSYSGGSILNVGANGSALTAASGDLAIVSNSTGKIIFGDSASNFGSQQTNMVIDGSNGNVGIGVTAPTERLEVSGKIKGTELCIGTTCRSSWPSSSGGTVTSVAGAASGAIDVANGSTTAELTTRVDNTTIEINGSNNLQVKDSGITNAKIATGVDASKVSTGTLPDSVLSTNVSKLGSTIESGEITDGTIADSDISSTAAIAWTKVDKTGAVAGDVGAVSSTTSVIAGTGLTGGGALSGDVTVNADIAGINYWTQSGSDLSYTGGNVSVSNLSISPGSLTTYNNLTSRFEGGPALTGALVITTNMDDTDTGIWINDLEITLYNYSDSPNLEQLNLAFYKYYNGGTSTSSFVSHGYTRSGNINPMVRLGLNGSGKVVIIIGDVSSSWSYPQIKVKSVVSNFTTISKFTGWTSSLVTDISSYTGITTTNNKQIVSKVEQSSSDDNYLTGNLAIGKTTPTTALDVSGTVTATALNVSGSISAASFSGDGSALTNISGAVTEDISLNGDSGRSLLVNRNTVADTSGRSLSVAAGGATTGATDKNGGNLVLKSGVSTGTGSSSILFQTAPSGSSGTSDNALSTAMIINGSGNVGIGTSTPNSLLSLTGVDQTVSLAASRNFPAMLEISSTDPSAGAESNILFTSTYSGTSKVANASIASIQETSGSNADYGKSSLVFRTSGPIIADLNKERMRINGNGMVGIGESNPTTLLSLAGTDDKFISLDRTANANVDDILTMGVAYSAGGGADDYFYTGFSAHQFVLRPSGNVGIGVTNPSAKLHVNGTFIADNMGLSLPPSNTFDDKTLPAGLYMSNTSSTGSPTPGNSGAVLNMQSGVASGAVAQLHIRSNNTEIPEAYIRHSDNTGDFKPWYKLVTENDSGNVGIGTNTPSSVLNVKGPSDTPSSFGIANFDTITGTNDVGVKIGAVAGAGTAGYGFIQAKHVGSTNDGNLILNSAGGNVGIGTTSPIGGLHIQKARWTEGGVSGPQITVQGSRAAIGLYDDNETGENVFAIQNGEGNFHIYSTAYTSDDLGFDEKVSRMMIQKTTGNVAIGTTGSPVDKLTVYGDGESLRLQAATANIADSSSIIFAENATVDHFKIGYSGSDSESGSGALTFSTPESSTILKMNRLGKVGVGVNPSGAKLHINNSTTFDPASNSNAALLLDGSSGGGIVFKDSGYGGIWMSGSGTTMNFKTNGASSGFGSTEGSLVLNDSGNLGVGTALPEARLQVSGGGLCVGNNATCNTDNNTEGVIYAVSSSVTAADYAEYFHSEGELSPGDLVGLNPENGLARLYKTGDKLLGIVSTKPGIVGNRLLANQKDTVLVALMGQVPVNADQVLEEKRIVKTLDGKVIGHRLASGDIYLNISSRDEQQSREIASLKDENEQLKSQLIEVQSVVCEIKPDASFCQ